MNPRFEFFFEALLYNEGIYSDHPYDKGGKTIFGISYNNFPQAFTDVYNLWVNNYKKEAKEVAKDFYRYHFYNPYYDNLPVFLAWKLFDIGVNMGIKTAVKMFQKTLNDFDDEPIVVDGIFGLKTLDKYRKVAKSSNSAKIDLVYRKNIWNRYKMLRFFNVFGKGWKSRLNRIVVIEQNVEGDVIKGSKILLRKQIDDKISYYFLQFFSEILELQP